MVRCYECDEKIDDGDEITTNDGHYLCQTCFDDSYFVCYDCGDVFSTDDMITTGDGENICVSCRENNYYRCDDCGEIYREGNFRCDDNSTICDNCYSDHYFTCDNCGAITHIDNHCSTNNGDDLCEYCYENCDDDDDDNCTHGGYLHQYGYHPKLIFHKNDDENTDMYFGNENEIDKGQHEDFRFSSLNPDHFWCDGDGSLSAQGIEIISHPMSYNFIMKNRPFKQMCDVALKSGYKSHNTTTCGHHVHMSRKAFNYDDDRLTMFIYLFEKFWKEIVRFSRRKHDFSIYDSSINAIDHYSARYCDMIDEQQKNINLSTVKDKKDKKGFNRYHCVNITNGATIEVRIFRGTLKESTIIANIQLCKIFFELSSYDAKTIDSMSFNDVKEYAKNGNYVEFIEYCSERGL
jgi:hypothetical protein